MSAETVRLAERMDHIGLSPTMKGTIAAEQLKRQGIRIVDLGAGEPDFPTPAHITAAAHAALDGNFTKYTANMGIADLREAVAARYREDYGVTYAADEVIITAGGKQALCHSALALFGPGDEVVTHAPGWPTITAQITLAGATPVVVHAKEADGFALRADAILAAITPKTRGIIVNSPGNPTGALLTEREARALAAELSRRDIWVVFDLCYERLIYDRAPHNLPKIFGDALRDRLVLNGSASKSYAMTGWRCGWAVGPRAVIAAANALQSHETSNVNSITQKAVLAGLTGSQQCVADMLAEYQRRRDHMLTWLAEEPRLRCVTPKGAFYLFPSVADFLSAGGLRTSAEFADALLAEEHVVVTAGEGFGAPGYVRLSYATSLETLREGATRLIRFARKHGAKC